MISISFTKLSLDLLLIFFFPFLYFKQESSITILQGQTAPMPNGIPTYTAQVHNICVSGNCNIGNIHLSCGWFSTARTINPSVFRRLAYDDCLVNDGKPLRPGQTIIFSYANTFSYPMAVKSVTCF
ncbi:hypothetical protein DCAR_0935830 [Daucus carota subsp. sativus]|uniref:TPD1 protein homolog 1-like n=1 Tax=Daucus carota subsp. sativus TaxID=79200 RepID=A0AAF1BEB5_DAUCS|nr:hypothetical protein DCAR_0935830 [Daucus carota subsp. sativus]